MAGTRRSIGRCCPNRILLKIPGWIRMVFACRANKTDDLAYPHENSRFIACWREKSCLLPPRAAGYLGSSKNRPYRASGAAKTIGGDLACARTGFVVRSGRSAASGVAGQSSATSGMTCARGSGGARGSWTGRCCVRVKRIRGKPDRVHAVITPSRHLARCGQARRSEAAGWTAGTHGLLGMPGQE